MIKNWLTALFIFAIVSPASSQTLFTYGSHKADAKDFLRAYNRNNQQQSSPKAVKDYLDLYINSRLKIREAYDRRYDTLPQIKVEVENLRNQVIENYMNDPAVIDRMTKEAFQRSLKDVHAAHIFISLKNANGAIDTVTAQKRLNEITSRLTKGEDFMTIAQQMSDDPAAKTNKGDLNYITVFTLPYEFENIIYSIPIGKYSKPHRSKTGYHIFKNLGERKALGKVKVQQILLAFPPGISDADKKKTALLADSIYKRIVDGEDFGKLASTYSNDYVSAATEGNIPDISVGQYDPVFEKQVWSLKNGMVSKPFVTTHGYHIVKRILAKPVITNAKDKDNMDELSKKVKATDRWKTAKDFIYAQVKSKAGLQQLPYKEVVLWSLSDSLLDSKPGLMGRTMNKESGLFKIGSTVYTVDEWINFAKMNRYNTSGKIKSYPDLLDEFIKNSLNQYYRAHLEDFNSDFRNQMEEFTDGNLFFEIMQQEVWNKAQNDTAALQALYNKNKETYNWKQSADAIIFFCSDDASAKVFADRLKKNPASWKELLEPHKEKIVADSARYEWTQIPGLDKTVPKPGMITPLSVNATDKTSSFALITKVYNQPTPRSFNEAKGLVMNDYQNLLEEEWIKQLRQKYPVKLDDKVVNEVVSGKIH